MIAVMIEVLLYKLFLPSYTEQLHSQIGKFQTFTIANLALGNSSIIIGPYLSP